MMMIMTMNNGVVLGVGRVSSVGAGAGVGVGVGVSRVERGVYRSVSVVTIMRRIHTRRRRC